MKVGFLSQLGGGGGGLGFEGCGVFANMEVWGFYPLACYPLLGHLQH